MTRFLVRYQGVLLLFVLLFGFLGSRGLNEPDEGRYGEIGREMAASGEWLIPHLNGFPHFQKPPFVYWATAGSIYVFGANEWGARVPSALSALVTVLLTYAIGRRMFSGERGTMAAIILATSAGFFGLARLLTPDMTLTLWITAAVAAMVYGRRWLFFVAMGFGFLTKGPMALIIPVCAAIGWQYGGRRNGNPQKLPWLRGMMLSILIGLSWFIAVSLKYHELFEYFWRYELVERFASTHHGRSQPFWFFVPVILIAFLPWSFPLLARTKLCVARIRAGRLSQPQALLVAWVLPPLVVLSLSGSKLPTYILPLLPALALALAATWKDLRRIWIIGTICGVIYLGIASQAWRFEDRLEQQAPVKRLVATLRAMPDFAEAQLFSCEVRAHGFEFYLRKVVSVTRNEADIVLRPTPAEAARLFDSPEDCAAHFASVHSSYGLTRRSSYPKIFKPAQWRIVDAQGDFILLTNRPAVEESAQPVNP